MKWWMRIFGSYVHFTEMLEVSTYWQAGFAGPRKASKGPVRGKAWTDPATGMEFVWVPGGCYQMGCGSWQSKCENNEKPAHEVCVDGFWMGKDRGDPGAVAKDYGQQPLEV